MATLVCRFSAALSERAYFWLHDFGGIGTRTRRFLNFSPIEI